MPDVLRQRVVGQDHAIRTISEAIMESRSGLSKPGQPIGSFFFLGPTGTGKTELARALAELLFQDERYIIRFDMSEFKEEHAAALLYGAPPGYVGYEEGGLLVNKIRQQPYAVVLFDEIEKAHASVFDIFLQIMDEGRLHDKLGRQGDFSNALIIFTSNIASKYVSEAFAQNRVPSHADLLDCMASRFRPEFLGRLTEIVPFRPIDPEMVEHIFEIQVKGLHQLLAGQNIELNITPAAAKHIAKMGFSPDFGARPLASVIRGQLRRPLSGMIISGELTPGSKITLGLGAGQRLIWCPDKSE
jgi:ATP-dependent Clp protease ATP-binding subunit ClpA